MKQILLFTYYSVSASMAARSGTKIVIRIALVCPLTGDVAAMGPGVHAVVQNVANGLVFREI